MADFGLFLQHMFEAHLNCIHGTHIHGTYLSNGQVVGNSLIHVTTLNIYRIQSLSLRSSLCAQGVLVSVMGKS